MGVNSLTRDAYLYIAWQGLGGDITYMRWAVTGGTLNIIKEVMVGPFTDSLVQTIPLTETEYAHFISGNVRLTVGNALGQELSGVVKYVTRISQ